MCNGGDRVLHAQHKGADNVLSFMRTCSRVTSPLDPSLHVTRQGDERLPVSDGGPGAGAPAAAPQGRGPGQGATQTLLCYALSEQAESSGLRTASGEHRSLPTATRACPWLRRTVCFNPPDPESLCDTNIGSAAGGACAAAAGPVYTMCRSCCYPSETSELWRRWGGRSCRRASSHGSRRRAGKSAGSSPPAAPSPCFGTSGAATPQLLQPVRQKQVP